MNGLLKGLGGTSAANVRPLWDVPGLADNPVSEAQAAMAALRLELDSALAAVAARDEQLERLETEVAESAREAKEQGRALGLEEAETRSAEMLEALRDGVSGALEEMAAGLADLERLAVLIARESLARIVGDPEQHAALIARIIRGRMEKIEGQAVVAVEVSSANFKSEAEVAPLLGRSGIAIRISDDLDSGDCRIRLRLGTLEVGLGRQWEAIRELLDSAVQDEPR
ncbi:MAG TPA: hypothetical protein VIT45_16755 [Allosphingosinicella sp.]